MLATALRNILLVGEMVPCEPRWTSTLPNCRQHLSKPAVYGLGV